MDVRGWLATGSCALVFIGALEERAGACICLPISELFAPSGGTHPVDAPLVFVSSCGGDTSPFAVTIDGEPGMLVAENPSAVVHDAHVVPAPTEGAEIVVTYCPEGNDLAPCSDPVNWQERARFVVGALDEQAPAPATEILLEPQDGEFFAGCDGLASDLSLAATVRIDAPEVDTWLVVAFERDGEVVDTTEHTNLVAGEQRVELFGLRTDYSGAEVCATAMLVDPSGNASEVLRDCDLVEDSSDARGCACTTTEDPSHGSPWWAAWLLAIVVRRSLGSKRARATFAFRGA